VLKQVIPALHLSQAGITLSYLERAPVVVANQSLLHVEPKVRAAGQVHVPSADSFHVKHELVLAVRSGELLVVEAMDVVVGNEAEVARAVQSLIHGLGEPALEPAIDEADQVIGELCLDLSSGELGGDEILSGVLLGCSLGSHDVCCPSLLLL
jgi:hypothetical protein